MKRTLYVALALALALAVGLGAGCTEKKTPMTPSTPTTPVEPVVEKTPVLLYFTRGEYLGVAGRDVEAGTGPEALAENAMRELLKGPTAAEREFGLGTVIPEGTTLNAVSISGGVATVDMSQTYESGGGSLSMLLRVAQVVYTLTQFDEVKSVAFKLDGAAATAIGGEGVIVSPSVTRADFDGQAPAILVESPVPGQEVTSPVKVSGTANVFEAQFKVEVVDPEGLIIATQNVMATSGTGTRGTFEASIPFTVTSRSGLGSIIFSEPSAKDGKPTNVVEIPVKMTKE